MLASGKLGQRCMPGSPCARAALHGRNGGHPNCALNDIPHSGRGTAGIQRACA